MPRPKTTLGAIVELLVIVAIAVGLALLIQAFLVKPYVIPSGSMKPTLEKDQRVLVQRVGYHFGDPDIGDIVVFHPPVGAKEQDCGAPEKPGQVCTRANDEPAEENFIKRIVATPGDTLRVKNGHAIVNGERIPDDFTNPCISRRGDGGCNFPKPFTIPEGQYFMMGDNRGSSDDSRFWGPVPREWIIGKAFATYWPPTRIGIF